MSGRGGYRENSGRPPRPPKPVKGMGPLTYLRAVVADEARPHRDRGAAARAILAQEARTQRSKKMNRKEQEWQDAREAGWWCRGWHIGYDDPSVDPSDPRYGTNLLCPDDPPRDPKAKPYRLVHPDETTYRIQLAEKWRQRTGEVIPVDTDEPRRIEGEHIGSPLPPDDE